MKKNIKKALHFLHSGFRNIMFWRGFSRRNKAGTAIFGIILLGFSSLYIWNAIHPEKAAGAWWNSNWSYRKAVNVSAHTAQEFNVYLDLSSGNAIDTSDSSKFQADCGDLRFTDQSGNILPYYIVSGCGTASTVVHVFVSNFPAGAQTFYYYYGNPNANNGFSASDFTTAASNVTIGSIGSEENGPAPISYWKFDDATGTTANDSEGSYTGTLTGSTLPSWQQNSQCVINNCLSFPGGTSGSVTVSATVPGVKSVSFWVRSASSSAALVDLNAADASIIATNGVVSAPNITSPTIYVNGIAGGAFVANQWNFVTVTTASGISASVIKIGNVKGDYLAGYIDDVKFYDYQRSAGQVKSGFNSRGSSVAGASVLGAYTNSVLSNGLSGYWKFDESSGNASDSSGNSLTLTNNNTTPYNTGKFANAPTFNGSNMYFNTSTSISGLYTVAFWVNPASTTDNFINLASGVYINASSGTISATGFTNPTIYVNGVVSSTIASGSWQHVVVTSTTPITANAFEVGRANGSYAANNSQIDDLRVYNRTFSGSDVSLLYNWAPGPLGYWTFEEGQGDTLNDVSGNGNNGTWTNGLGGVQWTTGKYGGGGNFTGSNFTSGSYARVNRTISDDFTIGFWINTTTNPGGTGAFNSADGLVMADAPGDTSTFGMSIWENPARIYFGDANSGGTVKSSTGLADGKWHYIVGTRSKTTGLLSIYIDGVLNNTGTGNTKSLTQNSFMYFGRSNAGQYYHGKMDDIKIYNYVRTQKQIVSDMNASRPNVTAGLPSALINWRFDEGYGTTAYNSGSLGSLSSGTGLASLTNMSSPATAVSGWSQDGKIKKAISFDGINDYVETGDVFYSDTLTVCAWVYDANVDSNARSVVIKRNVTGTTVGTNEWALSVVSGNVFWQSWWNGGTTLAVNVGGSTVMSPNKWYHICGVQQGNGQLDYVYINGKQDGSALQSNTMNDTTMHIQVGAPTNNNANRYWTGKVDEVHIYDYALTPAEVLNEYNQSSSSVLGALSDTSGLAGGSIASNSANAEYCVPGGSATCDSPVGRWDFEEGNGATANDSSGNAATGTITGAKFAPGVVGKSLKFSGGTDAVTVSSSLATNTVEFWVNPSTTTQNLIDLRTAATAANITVSGGTISATGFTSPTIYVNGLVSSTLVANKWQHVAITTSSQITANAIRFGRVSSTSLTGSLDSIRFFNYVRTPAQVAWDYNHGGPVAYWKMDECQGLTLNDSSGNGNSATMTIGGSGTNTSAGTCNVSSASSIWYNGRIGKYNSSFAPDGTDDYATVADSASLDQLTTNFSLSAWVKRNASGSDDVIYDSGTQSSHWFVMISSLNTFCFTVRNVSDYCGTKTITDSNWHHLVVVKNSDSGTNVTMYLDGNLYNTASVGSVVTPSGNKIIGTWTEGTGPDFNGQIDDLRLYNYPLTLSQIRNVYNQGASTRFGPITGTP